MNNPNGPYPGRQLFLGLTPDSLPCFGYLVTGRSPESRQRKAVPVDNTVRIGPLGDQPYDPLRHYSSLKLDNAGLAAVSNGIQTEAIFEMYELLAHTGNRPGADFMEKILDGADAEPDSYHTPRIAGVVTSWQNSPVFIIGMKGSGTPAKAWEISPLAGQITGISTYRGGLDSPESRQTTDNLPVLNIAAGRAADHTGYLFDISAAEYNGNDIRVTAVAGIFNGQIWDIGVRNTHQE